MAINQKQIDEWFEDPVVGDSQVKAYKEILAAGKTYAEVINRAMPDCEQKLQIIQQVRSSVLSSELAIKTQWPKSIFSVN